jgi:hypothetical protein
MEGRARPRAVTALERREAAADLRPIQQRGPAVDHWSRAVEIRREWLAHGLCTRPANRIAAEHSLTRIYARLSRARPRFVWVDSPYQALPLVACLPTHEVLHTWIRAKCPPGAPPLASDLVAALSRLRSALDGCLTHPDLDPPPSRRPKTARANKRAWSGLPPLDALDAGVPLREVLRHGVWQALRTSLADGFYLAVRAVLAAPGQLPTAWYGQQDAYWIAYYDMARRNGLARFRPADNDHLDDWATLARSCGWWWPGEEVCVVVERPASVHTEPVPGGWYDEVRLRHGSRPAVEYRDGWCPPPGGRITAAGAMNGQDRNSAPATLATGHTRAGIREVSR